MKRLSSQDASFLHLEDAVSHLHIGSVGIFEGPPPSSDALTGMVRAHLPRVPRYRQRVHFTPLGLARPVWVDDPHFNLDYHLRRTGLPEPGDDEQLRNLVGRVMSQQLDRHKPLWETWMIERPRGDRWALLTKVHHCMVDGVSGAELLSVMLDAERHADLPAPDDWRAERQPPGSSCRCARSPIARVSPLESLRGRPAAAPPPGGRDRAGPPRHDGPASAPAVVVAQRANRASPALGVGARSAVRRQAHPLGLRRDRQRRGADSDRRGLSRSSRGTRRVDRPVRAHARPVSVRSADERGDYNNRVSAIFADLPVGIGDPALAARGGARADDPPEAVPRGGGRRRAGGPLGVRPGLAPRTRPAGRHPGATAEREHSHNERPRAAASRSMRPAVACSSASPTYRSVGTSA